MDNENPEKVVRKPGELKRLSAAFAAVAVDETISVAQARVPAAWARKLRGARIVRRGPSLAQSSGSHHDAAAH
jgi:hypothetical protein